MMGGAVWSSAALWNGVTLLNDAAVGVYGMILSAAFCGITWTRGKKWAYGLSMAAILLALAALLLLCELGAPVLTKLMAPSFSGEKMALTVGMVRSMLPAILFVGILGLQKAALNLMGDFRSEGISNVVFNCAMVAGVLLAARQDRIDILIHSFIAAAFLQWLVQFRSVRRAGLRPAFPPPPQTTQKPPPFFGRGSFYLPLFYSH